MMKHFCLVAALTALGSIASLACTTTTTTSGPAGAADPDAGSADAAEAGDVPIEDAGTDAAKGDGRVGTRSDKGDKSVDVDFSGHGSYSCEAVCTGAGGTCKPGRGNGVGYVDRKYNDGSGSTGGQITSCTDPESYASGNTKMTSMVCYCSDMTVPPTVRVRKAEGLFTCSRVCTSWSLTCSTTRKHYSFSDEVESSSTKLDCDTVPAATSHHYTCACDL